jgi:hypothetical protein
VIDASTFKNPAYWKSLGIVSLFAIAAVMAPFIGKDQVLYVVGALFVMLFWMLAWWQPKIILLLIFASAPFQNDLGDAGGGNDAQVAQQSGGTHYSFTEVSFALAAPIFVARQLVRKKSFTLGPVAVTAMFYIGVCLFSLILNWYDIYEHNKNAVTSEAQMILYTQVAVCMFCCYPDSPLEAELAFYGLVVVGVFLSIVGFATGSNYFLGLHKNGVGSSLASCAVVAVEMWFSAESKKAKTWLGIGSFIIMAGLLSTLSRGAWIATAVGVAIILIMRGEVKLMFKLIAMMVPLVVVMWFSLSQVNRDYIMGFESTRTNISDRLKTIEISKRLFAEHPIYGIGVNLRKEYDATDIFWCVAAETGVLGLATFAAIYISLAWMAFKTCQRLTKDDPLFKFAVLGAALSFGRVMHGMVDHYWSRGAITTAWAAVGLATAVYYLTLDRPLLAHADWPRGFPMDRGTQEFPLDPPTHADPDLA